MASSVLTKEALSPPAGRAGARSGIRRTGVFVVGCLIALLAAAAWMLSALLSAPIVVAALSVWAREFEWAKALLDRVQRWTRLIWRRTRAHPIRWGVGTALSLTGTGTAYWLLVG